MGIMIKTKTDGAGVRRPVNDQEKMLAVMVVPFTRGVAAGPVAVVVGGVIVPVPVAVGEVVDAVNVPDTVPVSGYVPGPMISVRAAVLRPATEMN